MKNSFKVFIEKLFAYSCICCGAPVSFENEKNNVLCKKCRDVLKQSKPKEKDGIYSAISYRTDQGKSLVLYMKTHNSIAAFNYSSELIATRLIKENIPHISEYFIAFAPRNLKSFIKNRFDQSYEIGKSLAYDLFDNEKKCVKLFKNNIFMKQQKTLNSLKRHENIHKNVKIRKNVIVPEKLIIIDDVTTTGSTLRHLEDLARNSGAKSVILCSLAVSD